jgi:hypothetical protein
VHGEYRAWRMPSFIGGGDQDEGYTDKKEKSNFSHMYGAVEKSYMTNGLLIYG